MNTIKLFCGYIKHSTDDESDVLKYNKQKGVIYDSTLRAKRFLKYPENSPYWRSKFVTYRSFYEKIYNCFIPIYMNSIC